MKKQSEKQFQDSVVEYAQSRGWKVAHFRKATARPGVFVTPAAYDGKGFPDLTMVRRERVIWAEMKAAGGALRPEQIEWLAALSLVGPPLNMEDPEAPLPEWSVEVCVWKPKDWPEIEEVLK